MKTILWFRRDLRIDDSMLLAQNGEVLPIFIFDKNILEGLDKGDKRVNFIYNAVLKLKSDLKTLGLDLAIFHDTPKAVFTYLKSLGYEKVYASIDYDHYARQRDEEVGKIIPFYPLHDCYIFEPTEILKSDGTPYLVFTPYYKACKQNYTQFYTLLYVKGNNWLSSYDYTNIPTLQEMGFYSLHVKTLPPLVKLENFMHKIEDYSDSRDYFALDSTSSLSVDIRFGTISIRAILRFLSSLKEQGYDIEPFFRQLVFRDYYAYLLYHFPSLEWKNYKRFTPTYDDELLYQKFCDAQTGYPLIDAAIIELKNTGTMHNRARMIVGSFFTKHLMLPWQKGEAFFAKYLLDYDKASNVLSWQWCAGTGIDPQPYFRIFNPYSQSKKFDKEAIYIKSYLPLLKDIPARYLHDENYLFSNTIKGYPKPIIRHKVARERFLELSKEQKNHTN